MDRKADVFLVPALGGQERKLAETRIPTFGGEGTCLNWSPDSRWLAVCDADASDFALSLFLLSVDSGEMRRLTPPPEGSGGGDVSPAFSPDGRSLAFTRSGSGWFNDIYLLDLGDQVIGSLFMDNYDVVEDGIYFVRELTPEGGAWIQLLRFAKGAVERILRFEGDPWLGLSVSPDDRSILYCQRDPMELDIMLVGNFR